MATPRILHLPNRQQPQSPLTLFEAFEACTQLARPFELKENPDADLDRKERRFSAACDGFEPPDLDDAARLASPALTHHGPQPALRLG